jgi:murein DD-endopeptidase MepM/ murein hydrolase activator NlpD
MCFMGEICMKKPELKACLLLGTFLFSSCAHRAAPPGPNSQAQNYYQVKIKKGDTLAKMGAQYAIPHSMIQRINGIESAADLIPGQVIYIPVSEKAQMSPDLRGRSKLVNTVLPVSSGKESDDGNLGEGERATLYTELRQLHWPMKGRLTSGFGPRSGRTHAGIDIMAPRGRKIAAAHSGVVEYAGWKRGYGWTVILRQKSFKTLYAHCSKLYVKAGQQVKRGQEIAQVGASGNAEGTHLHFEYKTLANKAMDPMPHFAREYAH